MEERQLLTTEEILLLENLMYLPQAKEGELNLLEQGQGGSVGELVDLLEPEEPESPGESGGDGTRSGPESPGESSGDGTRIVLPLQPGSPPKCHHCLPGRDIQKQGTQAAPSPWKGIPEHLVNPHLHQSGILPDSLQKLPSITGAGITEKEIF